MCLERPMCNEPTFGWFVKFLTIRFLMTEGIAFVIVKSCLDFEHPMVLLGFLGLLTVLYFIAVAWRRGRMKLWSDPGCGILLLMLFATFLVGIVSWPIQLMGLSSERLVEIAWELFAFLILLSPAIYHLNILEQCYYQIPVARRLERELGFSSDTNTLEGNWPVGDKYLYFTNIEPGGLMEQAGFQVRDIVVCPGSFTEFWYELERARGGEPIAITVVSWADPAPVSQRPSRQVMIRVPRKEGQKSKTSSTHE